MDARDPRTNRPVTLIGADEAQLRQRARELGWPEDQLRITTVPSTTEEVLFRKVPTLSPAMEVSALKSALLTFDHLLGSDPAAFTRSPDLQELRQAILAVIRDGEPADALLQQVSWGMDPDDVDEIQRLRKLYGPPQVSPFEHVLYVTGTKGRSVDLYFFVAGIDLYRYRLTERWRGHSFRMLCGCGMLAGDDPFGPIEVLQRFHFRKQTEQRAFVRAGMLETAEGQEHMKRVAGEIGRAELTAMCWSLLLRACATGSGPSSPARRYRRVRAGTAGGRTRASRQVVLGSMAAMVAAQAYIDRATTHEAQMRDAPLRMVPSSQRLEEIPEGMRVAVEALFKAIDDLVFRPVVDAPNVEAANALALQGFERFVDLRLAVISVLHPWLQDHPEQTRKAASVARGAWRTEQACSVLGEAACEWFSAAQSARLALVSVMPVDADADVEAILRYTLLADFALALGSFLINNSGAKLVDGLPLVVAQLAHDSATKAFALATQHAYADPTP